jgi:AcrR family transcriptional regulator
MCRVKERRSRRSAEDARHAILEAAERRLMESGPSALRLQEIAADVGISHPAVLHHFGSREGLIRAVVEHATQSLQKRLFETLLETRTEEPNPALLFERVAEMLSRGHARLIAWLILSGYDPFAAETTRAGFGAITQLMHARRVEVAGSTKPYEDTVFTVALSALALFAQALGGTAVFQMAGLGDDADAARRFRAWLGELLADHLRGRPA